MNSSEAQITTLDSKATSSGFNLETLRFLVAVIAHILPPLVLLITFTITSSISASYHTKARDVFVGMLFVIGALFWAYEGHPEPKSSEKTVSKIEKWASQIGGPPQKVVSLIANIVYNIEKVLYKIPESWVSKIGGAAAVVAAICPTACDFCNPDTKSILHSIAAIILFSAIVYFCLIAFWYQVKHAKETEVEKKRRGRVYLTCGWIIAAVMLGLIAAQFTVPEATRVALHITYLAETVAMELFGFAWLTASKVLPVFADEEERYHPFGEKAHKEKRRAIQSGA